MIMTDVTHKYLIKALAGTPDVFDSILAGLKSDDPRWDVRPDPERFTLREMVAHVADWNPIFEERIRRIRVEEEPVLPSYDEGQFAIDRDYAHSNPIANLNRFREGRATLVALYNEIRDDEWERVGFYAAVNRFTIETYLALMVGHDGYHTAQAANWLKET
jgi:hypothetical protein